MKRLILALLAASSLLSGCAESDPVAEPVSSISVSEIPPFGPEGGTQAITVTSSGDWRLSGKADWVSASVSEGKNGETIRFTALPNESAEPRNAVFKVFTGNAVTEIRVTSEIGYYLILDEDSSTNLIPSQGGELAVKLKTNIRDLECVAEVEQQWVSYSARKDLFGITHLIFSVAPTDLYQSRSAGITVSGQERSANFSVTQSKIETLFVEEEYLEFDLEARDITIAVQHSVDYNVVVDPEAADWITLKGISEAADPDGDGLMQSEVSLHLDEGIFTNTGTISFTSREKVMQTVQIKQQDPNAQYAKISDANLRKYLFELGWLADDSEQSEVTGPGFTSTFLEVASPDMMVLDIGTIDGLSAFPALEEVALDHLTVKDIDLTDCDKIRRLGLYKLYNVTDIDTGSNPVLTIDLYVPHLFADHMNISGERISEIIIGSTDQMVQYESCTYIDVTGCPGLKTLKAKREPYGGGKVVLKTIYMTSRQAETVTVLKSDQTSVVIKD